MTTIQKLADSEKVLDAMLYLKQRWSDERKYENFDDYKVALQRAMPKGATVVSLSKSFVAVVKVGSTNYEMITRDKGRGVYCLAYRVSK